jgi:hypothetical protein
MANFAAHQPSCGRVKNLGSLARCFASTEILHLRAQYTDMMNVPYPWQG